MAAETALSDGEIAYIYIQANLFEVEKAELGLAQGTSDGVKAHGQLVAKDHRGVVKMFEEILHMNNVNPVAPDGSASTLSQHQAVMAALKSKKGAEFDKAYLAHEVENHRAVIAAIRTVLLPAVKNAAIAKHMQDVLPAFEHHLSMTVDTAKAAGVGDAEFSDSRRSAAYRHERKPGVGCASRCCLPLFFATGLTKPHQDWPASTRRSRLALSTISIERCASLIALLAARFLRTRDATSRVVPR